MLNCKVLLHVNCRACIDMCAYWRIVCWAIYLRTVCWAIYLRTVCWAIHLWTVCLSLSENCVVTRELCAYQRTLAENCVLIRELCAYQRTVCLSENCMLIREVCVYQRTVCFSENCVPIRELCAYQRTVATLCTVKQAAIRVTPQILLHNVDTRECESPTLLPEFEYHNTIRTNLAPPQ